MDEDRVSSIIRASRDELLACLVAKVVSEMLGHADVAFTLKVYSHVLPGMQRSAAHSMNEMLF
jgi:integrase